MRKIWILIAAVLWLAGRESPALSQTPAELDINNSYTGARLTSDAYGPSYLDSTLSSIQPCVSVQVTQNGIFYAKMDFNAAVYPSDCDSSTLIAPGAEIRSFNLTLSDSTDCQTLLGPTAPIPCTINVGRGSYANKIFAGTLFGRGAQGTLVEFAFELNDKYYQLKTNGSAAISGAGSTRTATYSGDATLYLVPPSVKTSRQIGNSFFFPFQFTATIK